jgi:hypothetical protein
MRFGPGAHLEHMQSPQGNPKQIPGDHQSNRSFFALQVNNLKSVSASAILTSFVDATALGAGGTGEVALKVQDKSLMLDNPVTKPANQRKPSHSRGTQAAKLLSRTKLKALGVNPTLPKVVRCVQPSSPTCEMSFGFIFRKHIGGCLLVVVQSRAAQG